MNRWSISLALVSLVVTSAMACGPFLVTPRDFVVYKLPQSAERWHDEAGRRDAASLQAWCGLAGGTVTTQQVAQVMAQPSISRATVKSMADGNSFAEWLLRHDGALACLALAKQCERTREFMQDPWYYPDTESDDVLSIEQIEARARQHSAHEVQGRYALIAVRAMMSQRVYDRCLNYWDSVQSQVTCQAVRDLVEPYLVGCRFHMGDHEWALRQFIQMGGEQSAEYCAEKMGVELLDYASENPELPIYYSLLQSYISELDINMRYDDDDWRAIDSDVCAAVCRHKRDLCLKVASRHPVNEAMWLYAAAAMSDALGESHRAVALCDRGAKARGHEPLADHLRVLKFYVQAKSLPMGRSYDQKVMQGTRMLARLVERDQQQFKDTLKSYDWHDHLLQLDKEAAYSLYHDEANYYWNNMLNRIVVGTVVPRLVEAGKTTRALMLCNMAENHLNHLMQADSLMRRYDNATFTLADTLTTAQVRRYRQAVAHPRGTDEQWLVARGYNDADYWNELMGTKCLRDMDYRGAVAYLRLVSHDYQRSMNIWPFLKYDPMRYRRVDVEDRRDYKLKYARNMLAAQQTVAGSRDNNRRADAMMRLATGLASANRDCVTGDDAPCWALLRYSTSEYWYEYGNRNHHACLEQYRLIAHYKAQAFRTFTDRELAARWCYEWCEFRQVVSDYPDTHTARIVGTCCDNLRDYYAWKRKM